MQSPHLLAVLALAGALAAPPLGGQDHPVLATAGATVRVRIPDAALTGRLGRLLSQGDSALVLCRGGGFPCDGTSRLIPFVSISELRVADGTHWKRGALIGGAVGVLAAIPLIVLGAANCTSFSCDGGDWLPFGAILIGGVGVTTGIGALAGSGSTRWRQVVPPR